MTRFTIWVAFLGLGACGGGSADNNDSTTDVDDPVADAAVIVPDAPAIVPDGAAMTDAGTTPDAGMPVQCNVNAQTGCAAGQKCAWLRLEASPALQLGQTGCVPNGNVAVDGVCAWGAAGEATGYDNCAQGLYCVSPATVDEASGVCADTCSLDGSGDDCGPDFACTQYANTFANAGDDPATGLCDPTCDPLAQKAADDAVDEFCGAPLDGDNQQQQMCVGLTSSGPDPTSFSCASVLNPDYVHGTNLSALGADLFINACAPRTMLAGFYTDVDVADYRCLSLCEPGDTYVGFTENANGLLGSPYSLPNLGITAASEECRYLWTFESGDTPVSVYSYGLGIAYDVNLFTYSDGSPVTSCTDVANSDGDGDGFNDAEAVGCKRPADMFAGVVPPRPRLNAVPLDDAAIAAAYATLR